MMFGKGNNNGDLFDTFSRSGKTDLFSNEHKRKRTVPEMDYGDLPPPRRYERYEPDKKPHWYSSDLDLGSMLRGDHINPSNYRKIQQLLKEQDRKIQALSKDVDDGEATLRERGREIFQRCNQVGALKQRVESLEEENARLKSEKVSGVKSLREKNEQLQQKLREKEDFMGMAKEGVKDIGKEKGRLEEENLRLRQTISERDATVSKLNDRVWKVTSASHDGLTSAALEAQAEQMLNTVTGLKNDVAVRDAKIQKYDVVVERMNGVIREANLAKSGLQREVEDLKRELVKQREVAEKATERAREKGEVVKEQGRLIGRILEENRRLGRE